MAQNQTQKLEFTTGDYVVYPAHGVGCIEGIETLSFGGSDVELYAIHFDKERMRLKIPVTKAKTSGLRRLSSKERLKSAMETLQGRSRSKRVMWSRRAQEYETKINSGDPVSIAEVLRDLRRADDAGEQSYSERQIYQSALDRLARELAAVEKIDEDKAAERLEEVLKKVA
jgi:CarD family transcriptional regulator